jgi:hypothetical protein
MRILRADPPSSSSAWLAALSRPDWLAGAITLKLDIDGGSWVRRATLSLPSGPRDVVIKCRHIATLADRLKASLRLSRFHRHWRGARWLAAHNFPTARPLALARAVFDGRPCELLILEALPGKSVLQHLADNDLSVRQQHALAHALGRMLARLAAAGRYNRDGKPSNLIVTRCTDADAEVAIIDTVAIKGTSLRLAGNRTIVRMLEALAIEPLGCRLPIRCGLAMRVVRAMVESFPILGNRPSLHRIAAHQFWRTVRSAIAAHRDPRPRVNPLRAPSP